MKCSVCGRELRTETSRIRGIGPVCFHKQHMDLQEDDFPDIPWQISIFEYLDTGISDPRIDSFVETVMEELIAVADLDRCMVDAIRLAVEKGIRNALSKTE